MPKLLLGQTLGFTQGANVLPKQDQRAFSHDSMLGLIMKSGASSSLQTMSSDRSAPSKTRRRPKSITLRQRGRQTVLPYPKPASVAVTKSMKSNKSKGTKPELAVRKWLWKEGFRGYRINWTGAPGKPDIAFPGKKIAIFVHGCFWHRCPYCRLPFPESNAAYWSIKLIGNRKRDIDHLRQLKKAGWKSMVAWECRLSRAREKTFERIKNMLSG